MKLQVMSVTPDAAKAWLKMNTLNRPVRKSYVSYLADCMKRGEWTVNHQAIALNGNKLIDGQHRLMALIESGLPEIKMSVVKDADTASFDTIDIGVKRTNADIFREDVAVMLPITLITKTIYGQRLTPRLVKPIYEKLHQPMREIVDLFPRTTRRWTASPIRVAALAAILSGESKKFVFGTYKAMVEVDAKNLTPASSSFVKQMMSDVRRVDGSATNDLLARAFTVFQQKNAGMTKIMVKNASDRVARIREIYKQHLGIK